MNNKRTFLLIFLIIFLLATTKYLFITLREDLDIGTDNKTAVTDQTDDDTVSTSKEDLDNEPEEITYTDISAEEAYDLIMMEKELVILDVSNRYDEGHIPNAINYYVGDGSLDNAIPTLDKNVAHLVYCHVDSASILGAKKLVDAGFTEVYRLEGNYAAWIDAGYEIEK